MDSTSLSRRAFLATAAIPARAAARPNLVLFISDDHGRLDSPLYGSRAVRTPNLERIAQEGAVFDRAYTGAAICIPSRAIVSSGLCSHRNGATANGKFMTPGVRTLPTYMKEAGYRVAHFGKSHFLPPGNYKDWEAVPSEIRGEGPLNNDLDVAAFERWLAANASSKEPLCLVVCSHSPHVYWNESGPYRPEDVELPASFVDTPETRAFRCRYYADIAKFDRQLGAVYNAVRGKLGRDTLFLYTSDNGGQWPFAKWNLYDAGIRMPMAASWPGVIRPGSRSGAMVHFTDLLPTFLELAGAAPPRDIDGRSFAGLLRGTTDRHRDEAFAQHTADDHSHMNCYPIRSVSTARFHYIRNLRPDLAFRTHIDRGGPADGKTYWDEWVERAKRDPKAREIVRRYYQRPEEELYDTEADPHETRNLAVDVKHGATLRDLRSRVTKWMEAMGDKGELYGVPRPLSGENLPIG